MEEMKNVFDKILYYWANHYITMATEKNLYKALHNLNKKWKLSDLNWYLVRSGLIVWMEKWKWITFLGWVMPQRLMRPYFMGMTKKK